MPPEPRGAIAQNDDYDFDDEQETPWWERDPSEFADPSCIECGGQGGWCRDFDKDGQCIWQECDCVEWPDE